MNKIKQFIIVMVLVTIIPHFSWAASNIIVSDNTATNSMNVNDNDNSNSISTFDTICIKSNHKAIEEGAEKYKDQLFEVIKNDGKYTYLLASYNLNVGTYKLYSDCLENITDTEVRAWMGNKDTNYGPVTGNELNDNLQTYFDNYKNILNNDYNFKAENIELLSREDAINYLTLTTSSGGTAYNENRKNEFANTSYWLKDRDGSDRYFINCTDNSIDKQGNDEYSGVRPVIKVLTKNLKQKSYIKYVKPSYNSSENEIYLNISDTNNNEIKQYFNFLKTDDSGSYYFSKYNLNVGTYYNSAKALGIQDESIKAWDSKGSTNYGRTSYKSAEAYFQDYKTRLFNSGYNVISIDYLSKSDATNKYSLTTFTTTDPNSTATAFSNSKYANLYANTTYWLKDESTTGYHYYINTANSIGVANDVSGLRPLIKIASLDITNPEKFEHGTIELEKQSQSVHIIAKPEEGYEVDKLFILDSNGKYLNYTGSDNNYYVNWNQEDDVNVSATFKTIGYKFISGNNQIYTDSALQFEVDAPNSMIDKAYVNDNQLDSTNYVVEGTKITLNKDYLITLEDNTYSLKVKFKNGTSDEVNFKVEKMNTVTFKINIDDDNEDKTEKVKYGNKVTKPKNPEREGCVFVGWYSDSELSTEFDFDNTIISTDTIIYAKWTKIHAHNLVLIPEVKATCVTTGNIAYYECSECHEMFKDALGTAKITDGTAVITSETGHNWDVWTTIIEATIDKEGEKQRICKNDNTHIEKKVIPRLSIEEKKEEENQNNNVKEQDVNESKDSTIEIEKNENTKESTVSSLPKTGDNIVMWVTTFIISTLGVICTVRNIKK